jgi:hypothetical protein
VGFLDVDALSILKRSNGIFRVGSMVGSDVDQVNFWIGENSFRVAGVITCAICLEKRSGPMDIRIPLRVKMSETAPPW